MPVAPLSPLVPRGCLWALCLAHQPGGPGGLELSLFISEPEVPGTAWTRLRGQWKSVKSTIRKRQQARCSLFHKRSSMSDKKTGAGVPKDGALEAGLGHGPSVPIAAWALGARTEEPLLSSCATKPHFPFQPELHMQGLELLHLCPGNSKQLVKLK